MSHVKRQTIDRLILSSLASEPLVSAADLAATWGEDRVRCQDWLNKFVRMGLCFHRTVTCGDATLSGYVGYKLKIHEYLNSVKS